MSPDEGCKEEENQCLHPSETSHNEKVIQVETDSHTSTDRAGAEELKGEKCVDDVERKGAEQHIHVDGGKSDLVKEKAADDTNTDNFIIKNDTEIQTGDTSCINTSETKTETGIADKVHISPEKKSVDKVDKCQLISSDHPYYQELIHLTPNSWQLQSKPVKVYVPLDEVKWTMVNTKEKFDEMISKLKKLSEIAMDLEHHSYRSFKGLVCLVQISSRYEDFIVDPIELKEDMPRLNEICTNKGILKVLHAAERDIEWLQRDFGVYVINMFDTQKAAALLGEEAMSLGHILRKYCGIKVNKLHQLADWRIRPIPDDMLRYAREDAHYLLYIHDLFCMRLLKSGGSKKLLSVYNASTAVCGILYKKPVFAPDSHLYCYRKTKGKLNIQQLECFRLLYEWRHNISLEKDESTGYTLPNKMMLKISHELPKDPQGVINCCHPLPLLVHENVEVIVDLVLKAIENVPYVPDDEPVEENEGKPRSQEKEDERRKAIKMVNELFLMQFEKHGISCTSYKININSDCG